MPNRDGTGPEGKGAKTGRQMGKCAGTDPMPCYRRPRRGQGRGRRCE